MNREKLEKAQLTTLLGMNYKMLKMFHWEAIPVWGLCMKTTPCKQNPSDKHLKEIRQLLRRTFTHLLKAYTLLGCKKSLSRPLTRFKAGSGVRMNPVFTKQIWRVILFLWYTFTLFLRHQKLQYRKICIRLKNRMKVDTVWENLKLKYLQIASKKGL